MTQLPSDALLQIDFNVQDIAIAAGLDIGLEPGAGILGVSPEDMAAYIAQADATVADEAGNLLNTDSTIQALVEKLKQYKRVLIIGDSITTYRYSYARLLKHLLPDSEVLNGAYSGYTSNHGLELTHTRFVQLQPDLVFIKYGVNDCKRFGGADGRTLVSLDEYRGNITGIVQGFRRYTSAEVVLLTPTPIVEPVIETNADYRSMYMTWTNTDLATFADAVRDISTTRSTGFVDLFNRFSARPDASLFLEDGIHPNFYGEQIMLKEIAAALT
jgi:lysophospholipase L1-like esterase